MPRRRIRIFVSYARRDFDPYFNTGQSRAGQIYQLIRRELDIGSSNSRFEVLRDKENFINIGQDFADEIDEAIRSCDCAIVFMSRRYLKSDWCTREFLDLHGAGKTLHCIELEQPRGHADAHARAPDVLSVHDRNTYVPFWTRDELGEGDVLLGAPLPELDTRYQREIGQLCRKFAKAIETVAEKIELSEGRLAPPPEVPARERLRGAEHVKVLLGEPCEDAEALTARLEECIGELGCEIARVDLSGEPETLADRCAAALAECDLYIQILGDLAGRKVGPDRVRQVLFQYELARAAGRPMICWRGKTTSEDELDDAMVEVLRQGGLHQGAYDSFQTYVVKQIEDLALSADRVEKRAERPEAYVILDGDESDKALIEDLYRFMVQEEAAVEVMPFTDGRAIQEMLADAAEESDGAIVIWGKEAASQRRARQHFRQLRKNMNMVEGDSLRLHRMALCNSADEDALLPGWKRADVLELYDGFDPEEVRAYLEKVRSHMTAG